MKNCKIGIILLAFLLVAIAMLPCVSATENYSVSRAQSEIQNAQIDLNTIQLPDLKSDEIVVNIDISDEFVSDDSVRSNKIITDIKQTKKLPSSKIPFGTIIKHSEGVTSVYDSSGNLMFSAKDAKAPMVDTPDGPMPATYVHEVPDKSIIVDNGNIIHVVYQKERILSIINEDTSHAVQTQGAIRLSNYPAPWIEGAKTSTLSNVGHFLAKWNVPARPVSYQPYPSSGDVTKGSKITIWNGLLTSDGEKLLQPVLEWYVKDKSSDPNPSTPTWTIATWWAVTGSAGIHSTRRSGPTSGDQIQGNMNYYNGYWSGATTDLTQGISSTLFLTSAQSNALSYQNLQPYIVLEGWNPQHLPGLNSRYLCGDTTFNNFVIENTNGVNVRPSSITGFVNNQYWSPFTYGLSVDTSGWPSSVVLNTEN